MKPAYSDRYQIGIGEEGLETLTSLSHRFDELVNRAPNRQAPYVGAAAFTTKAGIHASAISRDPKTYEHVTLEKPSATAATSWSPTRPENPT